VCMFRRICLLLERNEIFVYFILIILSLKDLPRKKSRFSLPSFLVEGSVGGVMQN
jgi:hypothetical protein